MKEIVFRDRVHAGQLLAQALMNYAGRDDLIVLDDGIATGSTIRAAVQALRQQEPKQKP